MLQAASVIIELTAHSGSVIDSGSEGGSGVVNSIKRGQI